MITSSRTPNLDKFLLAHDVDTFEYGRFKKNIDHSSSLKAEFESLGKSEAEQKEGLYEVWSSQHLNRFLLAEGFKPDFGKREYKIIKKGIDNSRSLKIAFISLGTTESQREKGLRERIKQVWAAYNPHEVSARLANEGIAQKKKLGICPRIGLWFRESKGYNWIAHDGQVVLYGVVSAARASQVESIALIFSNLFRIGQRGRESLLNHPVVQQVTGVTRSFVIIGLIIAVYSIIASIIEIKEEQVRKRLRPDRVVEQRDAAFTLVNSIGNALDAVASFGLALVQASAITAASWAPPLAMVAACFAPITIWNHLRQISHGKKLIEKLKSAEITVKDKVSPTDQLPVELSFTREEWLSRELNNEHKKTLNDGDYFMSRHFELIHWEKYAAQASSVLGGGSKTDREKLFTALQGRLSDKIVSHKLRIASTLIGVLGTFLLFAGGPIFWAFGVLGLAAVVALVTAVADKRSVNRLTKTLGELAPQTVELEDNSLVLEDEFTLTDPLIPRSSRDLQRHRSIVYPTPLQELPNLEEIEEEEAESVSESALS